VSKENTKTQKPEDIATFGLVPGLMPHGSRITDRYLFHLLTTDDDMGLALGTKQCNYRANQPVRQQL